MRVATIVLGMTLLTVGVSEASEGVPSPATHRAAAVLADGMMSAPVSPLLASDRALSPSMLQYAREPGARYGMGAMGYVPQNPSGLLRSYPAFDEPYAARFDPGSIPLPAVRTVEDHLLTGFVAVMLIAYQLRRKHRFLRPHQFST